MGKVLKDEFMGIGDCTVQSYHHLKMVKTNFMCIKKEAQTKNLSDLRFSQKGDVCLHVWSTGGQRQFLFSSQVKPFPAAGGQLGCSLK